MVFQILNISDFLKEDRFNIKNRINKEIEIIKLEFYFFWENDLLSKASSLAFSTIFSIVPVLSIIFMLFKLFAGKELFLEKIKPYIYNFLAPGISKNISGYIDTFLTSATIETLGGIGFVFLSFGVYSILSSIESTFNKIWQVQIERGYLEKFKLFWLIITLSPFALIFSFSYLLDITSVLDNLIFGSYISYIVFTSFSPVISILFFTMLIKIIPHCYVKTKYSFIGAITGGVLYYLTKNYFTHYTVKAVSYNVIYGSIATLPLFMMWISWVWIIVLFGVQTAFVRQNYEYLMQKKALENLSYFDKIKIAINIILLMIQNHLDMKKPENILDLSKKLEIPINIAKNLFILLEKKGIVKSLKEKPEIYALNMPIDRINTKLIIDAIAQNEEGLSNYKLPDKIDIIIESYRTINILNQDIPLIDLKK